MNLDTEMCFIHLSFFILYKTKEGEPMARKRKVKMMLVSISAGIFKNIDEAIAEANALKIYLLRMAQKNDYYFDAVIGVSEVSLKQGNYVSVKTGKRGRPRKEFVKYLSKLDKKQPDPHIHILFIYACPADTICNKVMAHINKKYRDRFKSKSACYKKPCNWEDMKRTYNYVVRQSKAVRKAHYPKKTEYPKDEGIIFTTNFCGITEETQESARDGFDWIKIKKLEYNLRLSNKGVDCRKKKGISYYRRPP